MKNQAHPLTDDRRRPTSEISRRELLAALPGGLLGALTLAAFVVGLALFGPH